MAPVSECLVMAKPIGPRCNMRCGYCYYLSKEGLVPRHPGRMPQEILERYIAQRLEASPGPITHFEWHGGEPTLLGLEYFRQIVRIQNKLRPPGRTITNGLQTNGILLNEAWADFLSQEAFSVGLSLDGPAGLHDAYRRTTEGGPTHHRVTRAFGILKRKSVFTNVLCVVHKANAGLPDEVYGFFREIGVTHLQFLPLVTPAVGGQPNPAAASAQDVGEFLCRVFDRWISEDVGKIVIQTFDEALRPLYGADHALCIHRETCGDVGVLERDGSFYACDHFVDPEHRIGSIRDRSLSSLAADPRMAAFGLRKRETLPAVCRECDVLAFCNGGCPKDRFVQAAGDGGTLNYLCPAYRSFFRHCQPELRRLADHMKDRTALAGVSGTTASLVAGLSADRRSMAGRASARESGRYPFQSALQPFTDSFARSMARGGSYHRFGCRQRLSRG